jgi:hypothetical protein
VANLQDDYWHAIGYGDPGAGKSEFAASMPKPLIVFFFDGRGKDRPYLKRGTPTEITEGPNGVPFREVLSKKGKPIIRLEYYYDTIADDPHAGRTFTSRMKHFVDEDIDEYRSMSIDSSTMLEICVRKDQQYRLNKRAKDPRQWWAAATDQLEELYMVQFAGLPINIFVAMHISPDKDQVSGRMVFNPAAPGRLQTRLAAGYSELYRFFAKDDKETGDRNYLIQTRSDSSYNCASQIPAPDPCENNWKALFAEAE